jgi:hypothetical protein
MHAGVRVYLLPIATRCAWLLGLRPGTGIPHIFRRTEIVKFLLCLKYSTCPKRNMKVKVVKYAQGAAASATYNLASNFFSESPNA